VPAKKRLEWSPRAGRDLLAIEDFYADCSQITADRVIAEIRRSALRLETHPAIRRLFAANIESDPDVFSSGKGIVTYMLL
jgi:plasmid stabilization system protein ParE